ncbi:MAG: DEAD/DEAH box helicase, partial [Treponema sp.]|nr:DEAD/DEAH box helicase [Treponema sp.]
MDQIKALEGILQSPEFAPNIVVERVLEATEGDFIPFPADLDGQIAEALRKRGIERIYTHQGAVWEKVREGKNVVVVTPTASGKTLCYNLPCLQSLLKD